MYISLKAQNYSCIFFPIWFVLLLEKFLRVFLNTNSLLTFIENKKFYVISLSYVTAIPCISDFKIGRLPNNVI